MEYELIFNTKPEIFKVKTVIMQTESSRLRGMIGKRFKNIHSMTFKMELGHHIFHTHGCIEYMDIIFVKDDVIQTIYPNCRPFSGLKYTGYGDTVIELPGNTTLYKKITPGMHVSLNCIE